MPTYLVTGATGEQGSAVVTHLLAAGANVHAVVRDAQSSEAAALRDKGVVLFQGDHDSPDPVFRAAAALKWLMLTPRLSSLHAKPGPGKVWRPLSSRQRPTYPP